MIFAEKGSGYTLDNVIRSLGLEIQKDILARYWDASCRDYPEDIDFLDEKFIISYNKYFGFPDDLLQIYNNTVDVINNDKNVKIFAWHLHKILFKYGDRENAREILSCWPCLQKSLGERSYMFGAVIFVSGIKTALEIYKQKGIPYTVAIDTLDELLRWINTYHRKTGKWGFSEYGWIYNHFCGELFRLGRLQFQPIKFNGKIIVYRNKASNEILVYSQKGVKYRHDGHIDGTSGIFDTQAAWVSKFRIRDGKIFGNRIIGNGTCSKETVEINKEEWVAVLKENDTVLNVHIPEGGKLDHDLCIESYNEALAFFKIYFPDLNFKAFVCNSWLLDVQLKNILSGESNIVKFQNDFHAYPVYSPREAQMYERVFESYISNADDMPEHTLLQKAIKMYVKAGNFMRDGAGFILINGVQP